MGLVNIQYSCLENPMDRGAWQTILHRITMSWTRLKQLSMHECMHRLGVMCWGLVFRVHSVSHCLFLAQQALVEPLLFHLHSQTAAPNILFCL